MNLRSDTMSDWLSYCPYMQTLSDILLILERTGLTVGSTVATSVVVQFNLFLGLLRTDLPVFPLDGVGFFSGRVGARLLWFFVLFDLSTD